jgi:hypothetical protein
MDRKQPATTWQIPLRHRDTPGKALPEPDSPS